MNNRGVLIGGAIVVVVVVVGLLLMANRATAPTKVNEQDTTAQEYPAGTEGATFVSPVAISPSIVE